MIVAGHTRLKAAQKLGLEAVPCIMADDLTEEQIKAFRLADNKTAEFALWDDDLLLSELDDIDLDMSDFGFDIDFEQEQIGGYENERNRTNKEYALSNFDKERSCGFYQIPTLRACHYVPNDLIGFNYVKSAKTDDYQCGVHFFVDDYQFKRVWAEPQKQIDRLKKFSCVLTPDWSLYLDMPMAAKIWNVYRSRLIGQMMQDEGMEVIPTLQWAEEDTFDFCFDGIEQGGVYAVSTVGIMRDENAKKIWKMGADYAIETLQPMTIICYGSKIDYNFRNVNVKHISARKFGE